MKLKLVKKERTQGGVVIRLPVQHRQSPHCPKCQRAIDTLDNVHLDLPHVDFALEAVTFHARARAGQPLDLRKEVKKRP